MKLIELNIKNYKSLSNISVIPKDLSVFIGPNASGKSNFANSFSFLAEVYEYGLETAIKRKGGYENIAMRKKTRSRSPVEFSISFLFDEKMDNNSRFFWYQKRTKSSKKYILKHHFAFKAEGRNIKADYIVTNESFILERVLKTKNRVIAEFNRDEKGEVKFSIFDKSDRYANDLQEANSFYSDRNRKVNKQDLYLTDFRYGAIHMLLSDNISRWKIYHFSSQQLRLPGVPTPNPELSDHGENLPALVDWIKTQYYDRWEIILNTMREIVPSISDITTDYLHNQRLGLFFVEDGYGRPWTAEDVSDGTILTLGILCSSADPRSSLILVDELENSLHPWIIKTLINSFRELSKSKNIILTSHSPVLIDLLYPSEIWCVSKPSTETKIEPLTKLSPDLEKNWKDGTYQISEFLDSGLIPQAVPGLINS